MFDDWKEACGIVGIYGHPEASKLAYLALYALQHRGQESGGIVTSNGRLMCSHRAMGLVQDIFKQEILLQLPGHMAIGHVRYSTAGASLLKNAQPFAADSSRGRMAVAHNGNLVNARELREELEENGAIFQSSMDTEVIAHLMAAARSNRLVDKITHALDKIEGSYSLVFLTENQLAAARDPYGIRPLALGRLGEAVVFASETCALDLIGAEYVREIEPGEVVVVDDQGMESFRPFAPRPRKSCIFEHIYFARPDSTVFGRNVYRTRIRLGEQLAQEQPAKADLVIAVPDSGRPAAMGYARASGLIYEEGLIRNHYVGRTFIEPSDSIRHFGVKIKLNPVRELLAGKRVVVVDDSIVRGTTSRKIVSMIREQGGAREVHMRISSPPISHSCFYGIDTPTREELIFNSREGEVNKIREFIGADSLGYLSLSGLWQAVAPEGLGYCDACFSGHYPIEFAESLRQKQMDLFIREVGRP